MAALVVRQKERDHDDHSLLDTFAQQCGKLLIALMQILLGGALASGILSALSARDIVFAFVFVQWTVVCLEVLLSILLHGLTASAVMRRLDRLRTRLGAKKAAGAKF